MYIFSSRRQPERSQAVLRQWGITDTDLRNVMHRLGYDEVFFRNFGRFSDLPAFENHAFIFKRMMEHR
jgi:hypothetical protein